MRNPPADELVAWVIAVYPSQTASSATCAFDAPGGFGPDTSPEALARNLRRLVSQTLAALGQMIQSPHIIAHAAQVETAH
jgi:hypothetical protein